MKKSKKLRKFPVKLRKKYNVLPNWLAAKKLYFKSQKKKKKKCFPKNRYLGFKQPINPFAFEAIAFRASG